MSWHPRADSSQAERDRVTASLDALLTYPVSGSIAARAGELDGTLTDEGRPIGVSDTIIAATALSQDAAVLTRNTRPFERIPGLSVETY